MQTRRLMAFDKHASSRRFVMRAHSNDRLQSVYKLLKEKRQNLEKQRRVEVDQIQTTLKSIIVDESTFLLHMLKVCAHYSDDSIVAQKQEDDKTSTTGNDGSFDQKKSDLFVDTF